MYLYCLECSSYLGSLGGTSCNNCGWTYVSEDDNSHYEDNENVNETNPEDMSLFQEPVDEKIKKI